MMWLLQSFFIRCEIPDDVVVPNLQGLVFSHSVSIVGPLSLLQVSDRNVLQEFRNEFLLWLQLAFGRSDTLKSLSLFDESIVPNTGRGEVEKLGNSRRTVHPIYFFVES